MAYYFGAFVLLLTVLCSCCQAESSAKSLSDRIKTAQAQGSITNLLELSKEVEALWPKDLQTYSYAQRRLESAWEALAKTNLAAREEMMKQDKLKMAKRRPMEPAQEEAYFKTKSEIVRQQINLDLSASTTSMVEARIIADFMGEVRSAMIPGYKWAAVYMNIAPPSNRANQPQISGMDPNALTDPQDRADYLKALAENRLRNATNGLQGVTLPGINAMLKGSFRNYCSELFAKHPEAKQQIGDLAKLAHLTEEEQAEFLK